ncbi:LolA-like protein [Streptomyces tendae]|uniref:hypothetical protein n=1 Tax=Streptomyces tendae TaxID=1932 RepID=UPI0037137742
MRRLLCLSAAAVLLCVGCSGSGDEDDGKHAAASPAVDHGSVVRAAVTALGEGTARFHQEIVLEGDDAEYEMTVSGDFDFAGDSGNVAVDLPGGGISHLDEVFADGHVYISGAGGTDERTWGLVSREAAEAHYVLRAPVNDPEHVLRQISAMRQVRHEGEETVGGVRAVHYRGMLDHDTLTLRMAEDVRKKTDDARDLLGSDIPVFADAWVDDRGRLVRTRMEFRLAGAGATVTTTLSDLGEPVRVTVPAAGETVMATDVTGILMG